MGLVLDANFFCVWKCKNYTATGQSFKNNFVEFMVHRMMIILFERILKMWESIKFSWFLFQYFFSFLFPNRWNLSGRYKGIVRKKIQLFSEVHEVRPWDTQAKMYALINYYKKCIFCKVIRNCNKTTSVQWIIL